MGNRARQFREMRGLGVSETAARLGVSRDQIHRLERGDRQLTENWARRLAKVYEVAPRDLLSDDGLSIPVKHFCARHGSKDISALPGDATATRYVQAPEFVMQPQETFGFAILDRHAEGINLGAGTRGLARPLALLNRKLRRADKVVVRHFRKTRADGDVFETLVGLLDRAVNGDLLLIVASDEREAGAPVMIRRARRGEVVASGDNIDYTPRDDDFAEILGVLVAAQVPL